MRGLFEKITKEEKAESVKTLIQESTPDADFFFMVILAVLMATFGILLNNIPVLIGSMLLSPLLSPILGMSLGVVFADSRIIFRSFYTVIKAFLFSVFLSFVTAGILSNFIPQDAGASFQEWNYFFIYFFVALVAGLAAAYSLVSSNANALVTGAGIASTIIPPLAAIGVALARFDFIVMSGAFIVFLLNVLGIVFAGVVIFSLMRIHSEERVAKRTLETENKENGFVEKKEVKESPK